MRFFSPPIFEIMRTSTWPVYTDRNVKYFHRKPSLTHFQPALELSANLMQVTPSRFKLKFSVGILMELH